MAVSFSVANRNTKGVIASMIRPPIAPAMTVIFNIREA